MRMERESLDNINRNIRDIVRSTPERRKEMLQALINRLRVCEIGKLYELDCVERALIIEVLEGGSHEDGHSN